MIDEFLSVDSFGLSPTYVSGLPLSHQPSHLEGCAYGYNISIIRYGCMICTGIAKHARLIFVISRILEWCPCKHSARRLSRSSVPPLSCLRHTPYPYSLSSGTLHFSEYGFGYILVTFVHTYLCFRNQSVRQVSGSCSLSFATKPINLQVSACNIHNDFWENVGILLAFGDTGLKFNCVLRLLSSQLWHSSFIKTTVCNA